jgi:hypothetical protein
LERDEDAAGAISSARLARVELSGSVEYGEIVLEATTRETGVEDRIDFRLEKRAFERSGIIRVHGDAETRD